MEHTCHAAGCRIAVPPKMFMCRKHWYMLPKWRRDKVWQLYRPGQEDDKRPSREYLNFTGECIRWLKDEEAKQKRWIARIKAKRIRPKHQS